jgi:Dihydrofolate reductase
MGRKTFESFGFIQKGRQNIVISKTSKFQGVTMSSSITDSINKAKKSKEIFFIGGQDIFEQTISLVDKIYLTRINEEIDGDRFFPEFDFNQWEVIEKKEFSKNEFNSHSFSFDVLKRLNT